MTALVLLMLASSPPGDGGLRLFVQAEPPGRPGGPSGEARVMAVLLEDALESADLRRAWLLARGTGSPGGSGDLLIFWSGRIAWASGLGPRRAGYSPDSDRRSVAPAPGTGTRPALRGDPEGAATELALSPPPRAAPGRGYTHTGTFAAPSCPPGTQQSPGHSRPPVRPLSGGAPAR